MKKITRMFKKKIRGKELEGLAKAFNVNLDQDFKAYNGWSEDNIYAKLNVIPQRDSLKLEAYFHSREVHYPNFPDNYSGAQYREGISFEIIKEIPYTKIKNIKTKDKLNSGTSTGTGVSI